VIKHESGLGQWITGLTLMVIGWAAALGEAAKAIP
jgi:hypothetical protein